MAELLGFGASVLTFAALAGQLANSAILLQDFFKGIQNAPSNVQRLSDELGAIKHILETLKSAPDVPNTDLERALDLARSTIDELSNIVSSLPALHSGKKVTRTWASVKALFKSSEISTHLSALERSKSMLLRCCATTTM